MNVLFFQNSVCCEAAALTMAAKVRFQNRITCFQKHVSQADHIGSVRADAVEQNDRRPGWMLRSVIPGAEDTSVWSGDGSVFAVHVRDAGANRGNGDSCGVKSGCRRKRPMLNAQ